METQIYTNELGNQWFSLLIVAFQRQAISWTSADLQSTYPWCVGESEITRSFFQEINLRCFLQNVDIFFQTLMH